MRSGIDAALASLDEDEAGASGVVAAPAANTASAGWSLDSAPTTAASPIDELASASTPLALERQLGSEPMVMPVTPSAVTSDPVFTSGAAMPSAQTTHGAPWTGAATAPTTHTGPWGGEANLTASERSRPP